MKTLITLSLAALLTAGTIIAFAQQSDDANDPLARLMRQRAEEEKQLGGQSSAPADATPATAPAATDQTPPATTTTETAPVAPVIVEAPIMEGGTTNGIRLNFRNAPLDTVLNYLSAAAGFHIVVESSVSGTVSVISSQPMTKDEAVDLLNSVLNKNGLALIRDGNILTVIRQSDATSRNIPVKTWNYDVNSIPNNDEIVTEIIPIRFVEARQLLTDISPFNNAQRIVANEAGNTIIITDTQANIRHLSEIIKAVDSSAEGETQIRVFPLKYANPNDVATLLTGVFPSQNGGAQNPIRFGGGGPGGFRGGGAGGGNPFAAFMAAQSGNANSTQNRVQKESQVIAVADARTQSVVVTASKDLMEQIAQMMDKLDVPSSRDQDVYTVNVSTGDPQQILQVLQSTFPANTTSRSSSSSSSSSQNSALQQRQIYNINQEGTSSSSSSFGGSSTGGGRSGSLP